MMPAVAAGGWWDDCLGMQGQKAAASLRHSLQAPLGEVSPELSGSAPSAHSRSRPGGGSSAAMAAVGLAAATAGKVAASAALMAQTQGHLSSPRATPRKTSGEAPMSSAYPQSPQSMPQRFASDTAASQLQPVEAIPWGVPTPPRSRSPCSAATLATAEAAMSLLTVASALGQAKSAHPPSGAPPIGSPLHPSSVSIRSGPPRSMGGSVIVQAGGSVSTPSLPVAASLSPSPRVVQVEVPVEALDSKTLAAPASFSSQLLRSPLVRVASAGNSAVHSPAPPQLVRVPSAGHSVTDSLLPLSQMVRASSVGNPVAVNAPTLQTVRTSSVGNSVVVSASPRPQAVTVSHAENCVAESPALQTVRVLSSAASYRTSSTPPPSQTAAPVAPPISSLLQATASTSEDSEWSPRNTVWKRYFSPASATLLKEEPLPSSRISSTFVSPRLGITSRPDGVACANAEDAPEKREDESSSAQAPTVPSPSMPRLGTSVESSFEMTSGKISPGLTSTGYFSPGVYPTNSEPSKQKTVEGFLLQPPPLDFGSSSALRSSMEALRNAKVASESARKTWSGRRSASRQNSGGGLQGSLVEDSGPEQEPSPSMQCLRDVVPMTATNPPLAHERVQPLSRNNDLDSSVGSGAPLKPTPPSKVLEQLEPVIPRRNDPSIVNANGSGSGPAVVSERRRASPPRTPPPELCDTSGQGGAGMSASSSASGSSLRRLVGQYGAPLLEQSPQHFPTAPTSATASSAPSRQLSISQLAEAAVLKAPSAPPSRQRSRMSEQEVSTGGPPSRQRSRPNEFEDPLPPLVSSSERGSSSSAPRLATAGRADRSRNYGGSAQIATASSEEYRVSPLLAFKEQAAAVATVVSESKEGTEKAAEVMKQAAAAVQPRSFTELRTMRQPSKAVEQVIEAVAALFGLPDERWASLRRRFDNSLLGRIASFDLASASRVPPNRVDRFMQLIFERPAFTDTAFANKFPMVAPLQRWCLSVGDLLSRLHGDAIDEEEQPSGEMLTSSISVPIPMELHADVHQAPSQIDACSSASDFAYEEASQAPLCNSAVAIVVANDEVATTPRSAISAGVRSGFSADMRSGVSVDLSYTVPLGNGGPAIEVADVRTADMGDPSVPLPPARSLPPAEAPVGHVAGLQVEPNLWALSEADLVSVRDLTISRKGVGRVTFHGETDCRGLLRELHHLLIIDQGEVVVYPDASLKPPVGQGLNKPASVTLFGCMPKSKQRFADPEAKERYRQRVAKMTQEKGATFEDYNCEDGTWKFHVTHF